MSVHVCWVDCLNQDLLGFLDFQDVACLAARTWLDERLREIASVGRAFARDVRAFTSICGLSGLQFL